MFEMFLTLIEEESLKALLAIDFRVFSSLGIHTNFAASDYGVGKEYVQNRSSS